jgi:hypothetical protein
MDLESLDSDDS